MCWWIIFKQKNMNKKVVIIQCDKNVIKKVWQLCDENLCDQQPKWGQNLKTQVMTSKTIKKNYKTQKVKLWQTLPNLKNSNCDKTQNLKWWLNSKT